MNDELITQKITGNFNHTYEISRPGKNVIIFVVPPISEADISITCKLITPNASVSVVGIIESVNQSNIRVHTLQHHCSPNTSSNLLVKSIVGEGSTFHYNGSIVVEKNAQKTDAYQRNENLLLSTISVVESKPELEILANDVRCTHGAATGPISDEDLWYLSSRGISRSNGMRLISEGFLLSALEPHGHSLKKDVLHDLSDSYYI